MSTSLSSFLSFPLSSSSSASSSESQSLALDSAILTWVLLPIFFVMVLQGILRQYISVLLRDDAKPALSTQNLSAKDFTQKMDLLANGQLLRRSVRLRATANYLCGASLTMRKKWLSETLTEVAKGEEKLEPQDATAMLMGNGDPTAMLGGFKQQAQMVLPNIILMGWVSYFFSGFVCVKLPFALSDRFKQLTQQRIMLSSLDVSYVSSLSWYFLNLGGLRGLFSLLLGEGSGAVDDPSMMAMGGMGMMMPGMMPGQQPAMPGQNPLVEQYKAIKQEINELEITQHQFCIANAERRIIEKAQKSG